jgi:hypothetical protein
VNPAGHDERGIWLGRRDKECSQEFSGKPLENIHCDDRDERTALNWVVCSGGHDPFWYSTMGCITTELILGMNHFLV